MIILAQLGVKGITAHPTEYKEQEEEIEREIYLLQEVELQQFKERLGHEEQQ